jgi:lia operon protein LiaF
MRNQGQLFLGSVIIAIGVLFLIGNLTDIDIGAYCWPSAFILLGLWLLLRPRMIDPDVVLTQKLFGPIRRTGAWQVTDEEYWTFVADYEIDLTEAQIPEGETRLRAYGFVGDFDLKVPDDVGVSVSSTAFVSEIKASGHKEEKFLTPLRLQTDNYQTAQRKVVLELTFFVSDVKVRQI